MLAEGAGLALAVLGIVIGGVLKGATGMGAPVVAVPILAVAFDVQTAVAVFAVPNFVSNLWQAWAYRAERLPWRFTLSFAISGLAGAALGTVMLVGLPSDSLLWLIAAAVAGYVTLRLMRPDWVLGRAAGARLAMPVGLGAGVLQGAVGLSAPLSVTFLSAMRLDRGAFIATVSIFFLAMSLPQLPMLVAFGVMTGERMLYGLAALAIVLAVMPLGAVLARRISREAFDRIILALLAAIALRLAWSAAG